MTCVGSLVADKTVTKPYLILQTVPYFSIVRGDCDYVEDVDCAIGFSYVDMAHLVLPIYAVAGRPQH